MDNVTKIHLSPPRVYGQRLWNYLIKTKQTSGQGVWVVGGLTSFWGIFLVVRQIWEYVSLSMGFPGGSDGKASTCSVGDLGSIPGLGRSPGEGNGNPLQYSCLENSMDWEAWWATVHGVAKSRTQLSNFTFKPFLISPTTGHSYICVLSCVWLLRPHGL